MEEYVPPDYRNDNFYERFMERRTRDLNNLSTTEEPDSFPFPIEPLRSIPSISTPKRSRMQSNDSGSISPLASSRTSLLSPAIPTETPTPHPSSSLQAQPAQLSPGNILVRSSNSFAIVPLAWLETALDRAQIWSIAAKLPGILVSLEDNHSTRLKTLIPFTLLLHFYNLCITCTILCIRDYCLIWFSTTIIKMAMIPQHRTTQRSDASTFCHHFVFFIFSTFVYKSNPKSQKYFYLLCISKEESRTVNYNTKAAEG